MKIIFYVGTGGPGAWDSRNIEQGIGGSEESLIYVSKELVRLGHDVHVYNGRDTRYRDESGVVWLPHTQALEPCDIFIAFRQWRFTELSTGKRTYLIEQDWPVEPHFSPEAKALVEQGKFKMILLNEHHRNQDGVAPEHAFICSNGVDLKQFDQVVGRTIGKCVYFSHPDRGLDKLRAYWTKIRMEVPYATLHAFWWQSECFRPPNESIGIMPMRNLGHMQLAKEILSADLFTYPSIFTPEISPVSCIKAQVGGAWPVVVIAGGMVDTIQFGDISSHERFADDVINALRNPVGHESHRKQMMVKSRERYSWVTIAKSWELEFEKELSK